jgi:hypothetical protein
VSLGDCSTSAASSLPFCNAATSPLGPKGSCPPEPSTTDSSVGIGGGEGDGLGLSTTLGDRFALTGDAGGAGVVGGGGTAGLRIEGGGSRKEGLEGAAGSGLGGGGDGG